MIPSCCGGGDKQWRLGKTGRRWAEVKLKKAVRFDKSGAEKASLRKVANYLPRSSPTFQLLCLACRPYK